MEEEYKIDIAQMLINTITEDNEMSIRIKKYLEFHQSRCNDYLYTKPKFKESARIFTHIFRNLKNDMCRDVYNALEESETDRISL